MQSEVDRDRESQTVAEGSGSVEEVVTQEANSRNNTIIPNF